VELSEPLKFHVSFVTEMPAFGATLNTFAKTSTAISTVIAPVIIVIIVCVCPRLSRMTSLAVIVPELCPEPVHYR